MSDKERKEILEQFKKMKAGKLSEKEKKELLAKLRVTSNYYEQNKEDLEKEIEKFARGGK